MTLILQSSRAKRPDPTDYFDGTIAGMHFWHGWCEDGERSPYRLNTVEWGGKFFTWFADKVDVRNAAEAIQAGNFEIWKPLWRSWIRTKFNPGRLP